MTDTDNDEEQNKQSDARIILGPLVKYAAVGFILVSIIITTAVMLDRQFNNIDREVAELHAQLAQGTDDTMVVADADTTAGSRADAASTVETDAVQQEPATSAIIEVVEVAEVVEAEKADVIPVVENSVDTIPDVTQAAAQDVKTEIIVTESAVIEDAVDEEPVVEAAVADQANRHSDYFDKSFDQMIAERNNYLREMDRVHLEEFKASRERHLQHMRERLARQERRIQEVTQRNQELYDYRAANVEEMQQWRENFMADRN